MSVKGEGEEEARKYKGTDPYFYTARITSYFFDKKVPINPHTVLISLKGLLAISQFPLIANSDIH